MIFSSSITVVRWAGDQVYWRDREYSTLTSLKAGFDVRYFEEKLGQPVFSQRSKGGWLEYTFRGDDFWAQTIAHRGEVELYAVTSCSPDFQPTFGIASEPESLAVTLKKTKLGETSNDYGVYNFQVGANVYLLFEGMYGALPGHYKSYIWGTSSTCEEPDTFAAAKRDPFSPFAKSYGEISEMPRTVREFAQAVRVNTFAETAPDASIFTSDPKSGPGLEITEFHGFQVGPSTVLWRSVSLESFPGHS